MRDVCELGNKSEQDGGKSYHLKASMSDAQAVYAA